MNEIGLNESRNKTISTISTIEISEMMDTPHKTILRKIDGSKDRV